MLFLLWLLILASVNFEVKAMKETFINDFMKTRPSRNYNNQGPILNDSHTYLNNKLMYRGFIPKSHEEAIQHEIELGHTGRKEFIPLMDQREKHEERANGAIIAGVLLGKEKPFLGQPLKNYAKEQRIKSQEIQRNMNAIKAAGHVDPDLEKEDTVKLFDANYKFKHKDVPQASKKKDLVEQQWVIKQKESAKRREAVKRRKDTQSPDAKRRYNERRKVMKRTRKG